MIGRADIEGSKGKVALDACFPQASYPYGNFSDTSSFEFQKNVVLQQETRPPGQGQTASPGGRPFTKGSLGHYF